MNHEARVANNTPVLDVGEVLRRARQVDPECDASAIEVYTREIAEMAAILAALPPDGLANGIAFRASWDEGTRG